MNVKRVGPVVCFSVVLLMAVPARAEESFWQTDEFMQQRHLFEVGLFMGAFFPPDDHGLYNQRFYANFVQRPFQTAALDVGLRVSYLPLPYLGVELEGALMPTSAADQRGDALIGAVRGHLLAQFPARIAPFVVFGGGMLGVSSDRNNYGWDRDYGLHVGVGAKFYVTHRWVVRVDVRDNLNSKAIPGGTGQYWEALAGLSVLLGWKEQNRPPADTDGDGITDDKDACPTVAGPAPDGCPPKDSDGDQIADAQDRCPNQAGNPPDGCPDRDGDGVLDKDDRCPDQKGSAEFKGCPDGDGDGVADGDDACPKEKGPAALKGCPDRDGDGVPDKDDRCPDVAGPKENQGCMPDAVKKFSGAIKGINFATGSAKIARGSYALLDEAAKLLTEYPSMRLSIEGHTDNVGKPEKNQTLSQARADAVRDYVSGKGIAADRLEAKGYGDTKPVEDNKTAKGRAANRRIEFHISAQ
jgi:outer membrane protein OmpA-like peptidoglycan-associated protein